MGCGECVKPTEPQQHCEDVALEQGAEGMAHAYVWLFRVENTYNTGLFVFY